jgi:Lipid A 3-O-deacylase (PagL)
MSLKWKLALIVFVFSSSAYSQNSDDDFFNYSSAGIQYYRGSSIGNTFKRIRDSDPVSGEIYYQRQINVSPTWNHTRRLPCWGLGLFVTNSGSKQYVGTIVCAYPFMKLPLFTIGGFQSNLRFAFGVGWAQKTYNKITNPENLLLSQKINTHSNLVWQNEIRLTQHHFINAAVSLYHLSNAKISLPNLGINIPALSIGYRYAFNGETKKPVQANDSLNSNLFFKVFLTGGIKQMQVPDSSYYVAEILSAETGKQISYSSTVAVGMFVTHDESVKTDPFVKHLGSIQNSQVGVYASYEYQFGKISIPVQFGVFLYNSNSDLLEQLGLRYRISNHLIAEFLLKAHLHRADLMHFGIGYKFK